MAIYRKGQASMDADGYITGYGTEWKTALTLIRPGATIVFATNPVAYATISEIVNDTSLRAISTGGAVVPKSDYVILLHDSITVDGLAQDVAETLRYYQGKETMFEEFINFLKTFDWDKFVQIDQSVKDNAEAAAGSAANALQSEQNAFAHSQNASVSASAAAASESAAGQSAQAAHVSESNANAYKEAAANSASSAAEHDQSALASKNAAAASEANAKASETKAAESESNAANSEVAAAASEAAAHQSELNASASAAASDASKNESQAAAVISTDASNAASASKDAAAQSAASAKSDAERAAELADQLDATNLMRKDANLSDVVNVEQARENLDLNWLRTFGENHIAISPDSSHRLVLGNDGLFVWQTSDGQTVPISITSGGTGASDEAGARKNLQLDAFITDGSEARVYDPVNKNKYIFCNDSDLTWGAYDLSKGSVIPLSVSCGGTGATNMEQALRNMNGAIGAHSLRCPDGSNILDFVITSGRSGFYSGGGNITGIPTTGAWWMFYFHCHLVDSNQHATHGHLLATANDGRQWVAVLDDGKWTGGWKVICNSADPALSRQALELTEWGLLNSINNAQGVNFNIDTINRNCTYTVPPRRDITTAQGTFPYQQISGLPDEWIFLETLCHPDPSYRMQRATHMTGEWKGSVSVRVMERGSWGAWHQVSGLYGLDVNRYPDRAALRVNGSLNGAGGALIGGVVDGWPDWGAWRDRPCGMMVEMPANDKCSNVFKVVQWSRDWIGGLDYYNPSSSGYQCRLNVGSGWFEFNYNSTAVTSSWVSTSDIRLKANLNRINGAREKLKGISGYTYYKRNALEEDESSIYSIEAGVIAQDVQHVLPEAVHKIGETDYMGVNYSGVTALTVNAINEMGEVIDKQQEEIETLKGEVAEMKALIEKLISK